MTAETRATYKGLWKCRDLEIKMLWTRLTLLGAFMALTYTGYGLLIIKVVDGVKHWEVFNLLAVAAGCFGVIFSTLWIATAKGSKGWFERYEAMLKHFQQEHKEELRGANGKFLLSYLDYESSELKPFLDPIDSSLLTQCAGRFSVSKIPIVMGQISLLGWVLVIIGHSWGLIAGKGCMRMVVENLGVKVVCVMVLALCYAVLEICRNVRSSAL